MNQTDHDTTAEPAPASRPPIPPVLYLPAEPGASESGARVEMRQLQDGRTALLAYTALDRLARCCGPHQPWVLYRTEMLDTLRLMNPFDVVVFDQPLPEEAWHRAGETG